jgi:hypothetical protein
MDIEEFYDGDPRRRPSAEIELGRDWTGPDGARYEISWIKDTGELYAMGEPTAPLFSDGIGDLELAPLPSELVTVEILGSVPDHDRLESILVGWRDAMRQPGSLDWLRDRLAHADEHRDVVAPDAAEVELPGSSA